MQSQVSPASFKVGDGATVCGWSDRMAYTVVRVSKSGKRIWIQRDNAKLVNRDSFIVTPGGFAANWQYPEGQKYEYSANTAAKIMMASLTRLGWRIGGLRGEKVVAGRLEFYDYNF